MEPKTDREYDPTGIRFANFDYVIVYAKDGSEPDEFKGQTFKYVPVKRKLEMLNAGLSKSKYEYREATPNEVRTYKPAEYHGKVFVSAPSIKETDISVEVPSHRTYSGTIQKSDAYHTKPYWVVKPDEPLNLPKFSDLQIEPMRKGVLPIEPPSHISPRYGEYEGRPVWFQVVQVPGGPFINYAKLVPSN